MQGINKKLLKCVLDNLVFMGRVKNSFVKRNAEKIIEKHPEGWTKILKKTRHP